jgi:hypothetical protein
VDDPRVKAWLEGLTPEQRKAGGRLLKGAKNKRKVRRARSVATDEGATDSAIAAGTPVELRSDADVKRERARKRKPVIPAGIRPMRLVNELTEEQLAELDSMGGSRADWDAFVDRVGKRRMGAIGPNKIGPNAIDPDVLNGATTDGTLRAAGAVLMRELRALVVGVRFSNDPEPVAFVSPRMKRAILAAYQILRELQPADTWRLYFMQRLLAAKVAVVNDEQGIAPHKFDDGTAEDRSYAKPRNMLAGLREECRRDGFPEPPTWLASEVVDWLLVQYNPGGGGGKSKKLSRKAIEKLLANPARLADAIERRDAAEEFAEIAQRLRAALRKRRT